MIPEVHACSSYLVITPKRAYRDNAGALPRAGLTGRAIRVPHRRVNPGPQRTATVNLAGP
jgi:hypothetical protein